MSWNQMKEAELKDLQAQTKALEADRDRQIAAVEKILREIGVTGVHAGVAPWGALPAPAPDLTLAAARALVAHAGRLVKALEPFVPLTTDLPEVRV